MNWFSMDNLISATLSGLFVSIVGAWIIKRFMGGGETNGNSSRITHRPIFSSVHVRIDSDFLKTSFTIFCIIVVSIYMFVQISKTDSTLSIEPEALQTQLSSLQATLQPQEGEKFKASTLSITGEPVPVNFPAGSYGTDVIVQRSTRYQLWADALQTMNLVVVGQKPENVEAAVYDPNGNPVLSSNPGIYVLPISGYYKVDVFTSDPFVLRLDVVREWLDVRRPLFRLTIVDKRLSSKNFPLWSSLSAGWSIAAAFLWPITDQHPCAPA